MVVFMFHSETWQECKTVLKSQFATSLIDPGQCPGPGPGQGLVGMDDVVVELVSSNSNVSVRESARQSPGIWSS